MGSVEDNGNEMNKMSSACWNLSSIFAGQRDFIEDKLSLLRLAGPLLFKVIQKIPWIFLHSLPCLGTCLASLSHIIYGIAHPLRFLRYSHSPHSAGGGVWSITLQPHFDSNKQDGASKFRILMRVPLFSYWFCDFLYPTFKGVFGVC